MDFRVIVSPEAWSDLRDIKRYISRDSPLAAERFGQKLFSKQKILRTHPETGRVVPEIGNAAVREIVIGNYRIMYRVNASKKQIRILRYWHAARGAPHVHF